MLENTAHLVPGASAPVLMLKPLRTSSPAPSEELVRLAPMPPVTSARRTLGSDVRPAPDARLRPPYDEPPPLRHVLVGLACALVPSGTLYRWLDSAAFGSSEKR